MSTFSVKMVYKILSLHRLHTFQIAIETKIWADPAGFLTGKKNHCSIYSWDQILCSHFQHTHYDVYKRAAKCVVAVDRWSCLFSSTRLAVLSDHILISIFWLSLQRSHLEVSPSPKFFFFFLHKLPKKFMRALDNVHILLLFYPNNKYIPPV